MRLRKFKCLFKGKEALEHGWDVSTQGGPGLKESSERKGSPPGLSPANPKVCTELSFLSALSQVSQVTF
jgi:hypothetical protein